jgi:hypothetical protein
MKITSFEEFKELARRGTFVPVVKKWSRTCAPIGILRSPKTPLRSARERRGRTSRGISSARTFRILRHGRGRQSIAAGSTERDIGRNLRNYGRFQIRSSQAAFTGGAVGYQLRRGVVVRTGLGDLGSAADGAGDALAFGAGIRHVQHRVLLILTQFRRTMIQSLYQFACANSVP